MGAIDGIDIVIYWCSRASGNTNEDKSRASSNNNMRF